MGCTTSLSQPVYDKQPLACSNMFEDSISSTTDINVTNLTNNSQKQITDNSRIVNDKGSGNDNSGNNIQFNSSHLVIISQDNGESDPATDTDKVVTSFIHNDPDRLVHVQSLPPLRTSSTDSHHFLNNMEKQSTDSYHFLNKEKQSTDLDHYLDNADRQSDPVGIKSVLKTVQNTNTRNAHNHILANRPIKTVTFMDSVTVVTVF